MILAKLYFKDLEVDLIAAGIISLGVDRMVTRRTTWGKVKLPFLAGGTIFLVCKKVGNAGKIEF